MTRASLLQIIDHVSAISDSEIRELEQLAAAFPYCQTAHILLAKAAHDQGSMLASQRLRRAATYAADRQLLRQLIEMPAPVFVAEPAAVFAPAEVAAKEPEVEAFPNAEKPQPAEFAATEAFDALPLAAVKPETLATEEASASPQAADSLAVESVIEPEFSEFQAAENLPEAAETTISEAHEAITADVFDVAPETKSAATEQQAEAASEQAESWPAVTEAASGEEVKGVTTDNGEADEPDATNADSEAPAEAVVAEVTESEPIEQEAETLAAPVEGLVEVPETLAESVESLETAPETVEAAAQEVVAENTDNTTTAEAVTAEQPISPAAVETPESLEPTATETEEDPDILPPVAPPIQPPMNVGSSRFEFGLGLPEAGTNGYELPTLSAEESPVAAPTSVIADFRGDDHVGYALGGGSRLGFCLQATDADLTRPLPDTDFFAPDALLHRHAVSTRPAPAPFDLINNFLRNQPRLRTPAARPAAAEEQADLSVRSTQGVPAIASESLAKIMVRQGKLEKAIEIYERLMVRQPEKKAYFADQIQQLKPTE